MGRKVFISFLGAGNYKECVYCYDAEESKVVQYVQTAITSILAHDFDEYIVFCTESAKAKHFDALKTEYSKNLKKVMIPDGTNEAEIWGIFQIVYNELLEDDEVIYDVTHSFRSLPMLGIVLLQYAKFLKKIKVQGIYYGAFEILGNPSDVDSKYPNPTERKVPLLNLTAFSSLQDWTIAANNFIQLGNADKLHELTLQGISPILAQTQGKDETAKHIRQIAKGLQTISLDFRTNRGKEVYCFSDGLQTLSLIDKIEKFQLVPPFKPIVHNIRGSISKFSKENINNLFHGVEWCINKG